MAMHRNTMDRSQGRYDARIASGDPDGDFPGHARQIPALASLGHRIHRRKDSIQHPNPPLTPNTSVPSTMPQPIANPLLPSAPASPPTPAPSPTPHQRVPMWHPSSDDDEDPILRDARLLFGTLSITAKETWLASIVDACDNHSLSFLHHLVSPRLKKDPFRVLPNELCFKVRRCNAWYSQHTKAKYRNRS